jgi:hypothetical protein
MPQPKPDQNLLNTERPADDYGVADDAAKVNVVGPKFREHPAVHFSFLSSSATDESS